MIELEAASKLDKRLVRRSFDRAAASYDEVAVLQREVGERVLERLDLIRHKPALVCDLGCGTGAHLSALMRRYRRARFIGLDIAPEMLKLARRKKPLMRTFWAVAADAECLPLADASCDLIFSNLSLQWCQDLGRTFAELNRVLRPGGLLMFSTLGPDTLGELRSSWGRADGHSHINVFFDMHDVGDAMLRSGLSDPVLDVERITMTYRDVITLMKDLKALGAINVTAGRAQGLTGKGRLRAVTDAYEKFRVADLLPATYEIVYGHAWRGESSLQARRADGGVGVPLSAIKRHGKQW